MMDVVVTAGAIRLQVISYSTVIIVVVVVNVVVVVCV